MHPLRCLLVLLPLLGILTCANAFRKKHDGAITAHRLDPAVIRESLPQTGGIDPRIPRNLAIDSVLDLTTAVMKGQKQVYVQSTGKSYRCCSSEHGHVSVLVHVEGVELPWWAALHRSAGYSTGCTQLLGPGYHSWSHWKNNRCLVLQSGLPIELQSMKYLETTKVDMLLDLTWSLFHGHSSQIMFPNGNAYRCCSASAGETALLVDAKQAQKLSFNDTTVFSGCQALLGFGYHSWNKWIDGHCLVTTERMPEDILNILAMPLDANPPHLEEIHDKSSRGEQTREDEDRALFAPQFGSGSGSGGGPVLDSQSGSKHSANSSSGSSAPPLDVDVDSDAAFAMGLGSGHRSALGSDPHSASRSASGSASGSGSGPRLEFTSESPTKDTSVGDDVTEAPTTKTTSTSSAASTTTRTTLRRFQVRVVSATTGRVVPEMPVRVSLGYAGDLVATASASRAGFASFALPSNLKKVFVEPRRGDFAYYGREVDVIEDCNPAHCVVQCAVNPRR